MEITCFVDSDWESDPINRKSISGWAIFIGNNLISWGSKKQNIVETSSTEAEFVAISEVCKDIVFIIKILEFLDIKVELQVTVKVDNKGDIFVADNSVVKRTKHIHTRYLMIREYIKDGIVMIKFVKSPDNVADIMTKNKNPEVFMKNQRKYVDDMNEL